MIIDRISIGGFRNIEYSYIKLQQLTALLAPNNYGKSNVLDAVMFASAFIHGTAENRRQMMNDYTSISINSKIATKPFFFEIEGSFNSDFGFIYSFSFEWSKQYVDNTGQSGKIIGEYFGIKDNTKEKPKYRKVIHRTRESAMYDATGRCNKTLPISADELVLVKLSNIDSWQFLPFAKELLEINVGSIDTIADPKQHFLPRKMMTADGVQLVYDGFTQYLYQLKQDDERVFNILISILTTLVPTIQTVKPVRFGSKSKQVDKDEFLDIMSIILRDVMLLKGGAENLINNVNIKSKLNLIGQSLNEKSITILMREILKAKEKINFNVNQTAIVDEILFKIAEVKVKCKRLSE